MRVGWLGYAWIRRNLNVTLPYRCDTAIQTSFAIPAPPIHIEMHSLKPLPLCLRTGDDLKRLTDLRCQMPHAAPPRQCNDVDARQALQSICRDGVKRQFQPFLRQGKRVAVSQISSVEGIPQEDV